MSDGWGEILMLRLQRSFVDLSVFFDRMIPLTILLGVDLDIPSDFMWRIWHKAVA